MMSDYYTLCGVKFSEELLAKLEATTNVGGLALLSTMVVLEDLLRLLKILDEATVPKAGIDHTPSQVVFNISISYARIQRIQQLLADIKAILEAEKS